mmetsp:Transcript_8440/g.11781  ORF Transcript_8440/g.11781 Transcript_8440/m.11781 type:complete len:103 (+) Transcript_8440:75-383(+)
MSTAAVQSTSSAAPTRMISMDELKKHNKPGDAWVSINGDVYDVSKFAKLHPGGELILMEHVGGDVTEVFYSYHMHEVIQKQQRLKIGRLEGAKEVHIVVRSI